MQTLRNSIPLRKARLTKLLTTLETHEEAIVAALYRDFNKPRFEAIATETAYVFADLKNTIRHLKTWSQPKTVWPSLLNFPSFERIYKEPYGRVLILAPWNYPFQLAMAPLIAAIAAGNSVVLKPSELTPSVSALLRTILEAVFETHEVCVEEGGVATAQALLAQRWDYIFFTGSVAVGKMVAAAAAKHLTPVTLELGGKNPCIVAADAPVEITAKRIVWGKFMNAGQTCIAPDYVMVHATKKEALVQALRDEILRAYGAQPENSPDYARIITDQHWRRLTQMLSEGTLLHGGTHDAATRFIAPTLIEPHESSTLLREEIFGPILPLVTYHNDYELEDRILAYEKPLALYVFTQDKKWGEAIMDRFSFGGGCINDTLLQFNNKRLPFGGVGHSGMGAYHGSWGFATFSHAKSVVYKPFWGEVPLRYAPYKTKINFVKKIMKLF